MNCVHGLNATENNKVLCQTPYFHNGVLAGIALFPVADLVDFDGEKVNVNRSA